MSQDLLEQKELWNVGAGATTTTIPMVTQSGLSVALSASAQTQLVGSIFDCSIGSTRCIAIVNSVSASGVLTLDSALPSAPSQGTQFVLTPSVQTSIAGSNPLSPVSVIGPITIPASGTYNSPSVSTVGKQWQTAQTTVSVTTTATANFNFKSQMLISLPDSSTTNFGSTGRTQNTGTGTTKISDNTYLTITGGSSLYFQVINNDSTNAITLNSGVVNVH